MQTTAISSMYILKRTDVRSSFVDEGVAVKTPGYGLLRLLVPAWGRVQALLVVMAAVLVLVCPLETRPAVGGARQPRPRPQVAAVAGGALELGQHAADDALPRAGHNHVRHV